MANWQNVEAGEDIVALIENGAAAAFKEATGQDMPAGFKNWSFRKWQGSYVYGLEMDAAAKALAPKAKDTAPKGGNVAPADAEARKAVLAWVEYITAGHGKLSDVPELIHPAVSRALQPVENLMPPTKKREPVSLMPPTKKEAPAVPPKGTGMLSMAAVKAQLKRAEKARKAG